MTGRTWWSVVYGVGAGRDGRTVHKVGGGHGREGGGGALGPYPPPPPLIMGKVNHYLRILWK